MPAKNIVSEEIWEKAKKAAGKGNETNYDLISHIYQQMGGTYTKKKAIKKAYEPWQEVLSQLDNR